MRTFLTVVAAVLSCATNGINPLAAEEPLNLRGQLYFDPAPAAASQHILVPPHVSKKNVPQAPIDFSYPETETSTGAYVTSSGAFTRVDHDAWNVDLTDGAKLKIAYDKTTKLSLGVGMWKVKMGVSKKFGGPNSEPWSLPERHGRAAALGRADEVTGAHILN